MDVCSSASSKFTINSKENVQSRNSNQTGKRKKKTDIPHLNKKEQRKATYDYTVYIVYTYISIHSTHVHADKYLSIYIYS